MKLRKAEKAAVILSALVGSSHVFAEVGVKKVDLYGKLSVGMHTHTKGKIDTEKNADVKNAADRAGTGAVEAMSHSMIGSGYTSARFGANAVVSDAVKAVFELGTSLDGAAGDPAITVRKYYLDADLAGKGHLVVGRQNRTFVDVAHSADQMTFPATNYAGVAATPSRGAGISYNTGSMFEGGKLTVSAFNHTSGKVGPKKAGMNPDATIEVAGEGDFGMFGVKAAVLSEKRTAVTTDEATNAVTVGDTTAVMAYTGALTVNHDVVHAKLVYTGGDAIGSDNVAAKPVISKDAKDSMEAFSVHAAAMLDDVHLGVYLGQETLTHMEKNGATDKDGKAANVGDVGFTWGVSGGYDWQGVMWKAEVVNTKRTYDAQVIADDMFIGVGAVTSFSS